MKGKVYIVGAGPGDPGLITMKGQQCLKRAEVVVYDRLIDDRLLEIVSPAAEMIYVGKSAKVHAKEQSEINQILVEKATEGNIVVRLKGGDPFVLGRGGEECDELAANGIPFEVVPGISSAIASPAYAGIPVTHRNMASSFAVITGHEDPTKEVSSINWEKLATGVDTLVFLMGMGNLPLIVEKLIEYGRNPQTPAALVKQGTTLQQQAITATLESIVEKAQKADFQPPVAIIVGEVVHLREKLQWFENQTLFGKKILVTRSRHQASVLSKMLAERGAQPIELPTIEIESLSDFSELDDAIDSMESYDWVIFTSANGVREFWQRLVTLGKDARWFGSTKIGVIGPATAQALEEIGLYPDFMPDEYTSQGIISGLVERDIRGTRILLPRANIAPKDLLDGLSSLGAEPTEVTAYLTSIPKNIPEKARQELMEGKIDVITFASSSTVTNLVNMLGNDLKSVQNTIVACIGPVTAATAREAGMKVDIVAKEQTIPGLVASIEEGLPNG